MWPLEIDASRPHVSGSSLRLFSIMPIYAYRCDACGHRQDVLQKMSDPTLTVCPACSAESFARQLSAPAFQLKGSGWYVTDFRDNGKKPAGDAAKSSAGDGGAAEKSDDAPDSKAASPAESKAGGQSGSSGGESAAPAPVVAPTATNAKAGAAAGASAGGTSAS
jgi:putative FmdB family regulatory protein